MRLLAELLAVIAGVLLIAAILLRMLRSRLERWLGMERRRPSEHLRRVRELEEELEEMDDIRRRRGLTGEDKEP